MSSSGGPETAIEGAWCNDTGGRCKESKSDQAGGWNLALVANKISPSPGTDRTRD